MSPGRRRSAGPVRRAHRSAARGAAGRGAAHGWLELLTTSGPFLTLPVVQRVLPDGLPAVPTSQRAQVRAAVATMLEQRGANRHDVVRLLLREVLGWRELLLLDDAVPAALVEPVVEHSAVVRADLAFAAPDVVADEVEEGLSDEGEDDGGSSAGAATSPYRLLGLVTPWGHHPLERSPDGGWTASPVERLAVLLRARDVPIGLATDGRWWALVWAPRGGTTGAAVWDAGLFSEDPDSLRAFVALLQRSRFLAVAPSDTLPALLVESQQAQEDVTVTLGRQVRDAVELLVRTLDRLDADSGGELLDGVDDDELYAGAVAVLMRIVFLLFAEDRRLLPSDDDLYLQGYSTSRLVDRLEQEARLAGDQALEHRTGAWHRLLATARALHGGVRHEDLRLPPYGGSLFDPATHPWLERASGVDDRTVLRMLLAVQYVEIAGERRRLTFRALDVEQIGYVYEGLLETEVRTAEEPVLALVRAEKKWPPRLKEPAEVPLSQVEQWLADGDALGARLKDRVDKPAPRVEALLATALDEDHRSSLDHALASVDLSHPQADAVVRLSPMLHWHGDGSPGLIPAGRRYVAPSSRRASTGTHYTPKSLAEEVVVGALEPLVFRPGPLETADRSAWRLRPSTEILNLRVADIAMGSGAFLVAACRYLADRVVEAWRAEGNLDAERYAQSASRIELRVDAEVDPVVMAARRLVAERCLYGVDINPLAVEMAKLSLWLVTMDSRRPFGFLDDRLVAGDSLLGVVDVRQLETLHIDPAAVDRQRDLGAMDLSDDWMQRLGQAADLRRQITAQPADDRRAVERKQALLDEAEQTTEYVRAVADRLTGVGLRVAGLRKTLADNAFVNLQIEVGGGGSAEELRELARGDLQRGVLPGKGERVPLHWPVVFPEVLVDTADRGFDAIVGNPPFLGGKKISGAMGGDLLDWMQRWDGYGRKGSTDLAARFVLRAHRLLSARGQLGYITTNTLVQGDTLDVGLAQVVERGMAIRAGRTSHPWPSSSANLEVVNIWVTKAPLGVDSQRQLDGDDVPNLTTDLEPLGRVAGRPSALKENQSIAFQGSIVVGLGFTMSASEAHAFISRSPRNAECLQPYVIGQDLNQRPDHSASRWIINFRDWSEARARTYPDLFAKVEREVKPVRQRKNEERSRDAWWLYTRLRADMYRAIADLDHVLALSLVSNVVLPVRVPTGPVFAHKCGVFALDGFADLAVLSSSAHQAWVLRYSSTMRRDINYSPSDVFLTLPRPPVTPELETLGRRLDTVRRELMLSRSWGLTTTYNAVHDPGVVDAEVVALREIHREIDHAVLGAYGWELDPQVGHHPTKIGTRWTVSREARFELLDLLLEENHRRHAAEEGR